MISELIRYRGMIKHMYVREVKLKYERSVLGFGWTLLNPLAMVIVYTLVFSVVLKLGVDNYPVFLLSGLLAWNFVNRGMLTVSAAIWHNGYLISRVKFPHESLIISGMLSLLTDFVFELAVLIVILIVLKATISAALLFIPFAILLLFIFGFGVALFFSVWTTLYKDTEYILSIFALAWFYITPILYPMSRVPEKFLFIYKLNPMVHMLSLFREPIYSGTLPALHTVGIATAISVFTLAAGWTLFRRYSPYFAELI